MTREKGRIMRATLSLLVCLALVFGVVAPASAAGSCSAFRTWDVGSSLTSADLNSSFSTLVTCINDYGTGITSYTVGDMIYASGTTALSRLTAVAAGSYLRSGGVTTAPLWSTATLPNTAVVGDVLYASATNVYSNLADVAAGSYLRSGGVTTAPVWSTTTLPNSATTGDLLHASATNVYTNLAAVATGRVLTSAGASTAPAWSATPTLTGQVTLSSDGNNLLLQPTTATSFGSIRFINTGGTNYVGIDSSTGGNILLGSTAYAMVIRPAAVPLQIGRAGVEFNFDTTGSLQIAGTAARAGTAGTNRLDIFDGTAPTGTLANGISLYSTAGELKVMDAGGVASTLSPHDDENFWVFDSVDTTTGNRLHIEVEKLLRFVNDYFGLDFVKGYMARPKKP